MQHVATLRGGGTLDVLVATLFSSASASPVAAFSSTSYDFEAPTNLGPWSSGADSCVTQYGLTIFPTHNHCPANGTQAAEIKLKDPNTPSCRLPGAWMGAPFSGSNGRNDVTTAFSVLNGSGGAGTVPLVYVGSSPPTAGSQFVQLSPPITNTWTTYTYTTAITLSGPLPLIYIGLGYRGLSGGAGAAVDFDCVYVGISP